MNSPEFRALSAYAVKLVLERMGNRLGDRNRYLALKILDFFKVGNDRANVAMIHETLFGHLSTSSANQALKRFVSAFNEAGSEIHEKARCRITENKKGGPANRWVWFEGLPPVFHEPFKGDLNSVHTLQPQSVLDISTIPIIVLFAYNNINERDAILEEFGYYGQEPSRETKTKVPSWDLGICGNFKVVLVHHPEQGYMAGYKSAIQVYDDVKPYAILAVGIGYGVVDGIKIGDVMIPEYVVDANRERVNAKGRRRANGRSEYPISRVLKDRLFAIDNEKTTRREPEWPKIHAWGALISRDAHISNKVKRDKLIEDFAPAAMGGDMESAGVGRAAEEKDYAFEWLPIKSVSDMGDEGVQTSAKEENQRSAARNAAAVAKALIVNLPTPPLTGATMDSLHVRFDRNVYIPRRIEDKREKPDVYIPSDVVDAPMRDVMDGLGDRAPDFTAKQPVKNLQNALMEWATKDEDPPLFALLGEYGMGKTVNCQKFTDDISQKSAGNASNRAALYFDLRNVTNLKNNVPSLNDVMLECARRGWYPGENGEEIKLNTINDRICAGDVVIFDGLDEVLVKLNRQDGATFVRNLLSVKDIAQRFGVASPKVLVSSRIQYFRTIREQTALLTDNDRGDKRADSYTAALILPFTDDQIREYISAMLGGGDIDQIMDTLESAYDLKSLSKRPYTLWLISELLPTIRQWALEGSRISVARLYREITDRWLERDEGKHFLILEHKRELSTQLAALLWRKKTGALPILALENWCLEWLGSRPDMKLRYDIGYQNVDQLLADIRNSTYLTRNHNAEEDGLFRFSHTSLQEYFLAVYLLNALKDDRYADWDMPAPNDETMGFLAQLFAEEQDAAGLLAVMTRWARDERITANMNLLRYALFAKKRGYAAFSLRGANLAGAVLDDIQINVNMPGANFSDAQLRGSFFTDSVLEKADFSKADLSRAKLYRCDLSSANLTNAKLSGAVFYQSRAGFEGVPETYRTQWLWCEHLPAWLEDDSRSFITENKRNGTLIFEAKRLLSSLQIGSINTVAWSPDSRLIANGGYDGKVRLWDVVSGECRAVFEGHNGLINTIAWSPDGHSIASGGNDGKVRLWDAVSGECCAVFEGYNGRINAVEWSPDGRSIASGSSDGNVRLWDAESVACRAMFEGHIGWINAMEWSPDGRSIASGGSDGNVRLWDAESGECRAMFEGHIGWINAVAWSPDGCSIASGGNDGNIRLWDAESGERNTVFKGYFNRVFTVAWSPDGRSIASGGYDGKIRLWDAESGECRVMFEEHNSFIIAVAWSPYGHTIASCGNDGNVRLWDAESGECRTVFERHKSKIFTVAWSPNGYSIVSGGRNGNVRLWDVESGKCRAELEGHNGEINTVAWSPDGRSIASGGYDSKVKLWDAESGECRAVFEKHNRRIRTVAWSPDSRMIASGGDDGKVKLWDAESGECRAVFEEHNSRILTVAWSPDGRTIACGGDDGKIKLWDAESGEYWSIEILEDNEYAVWKPDQTLRFASDMAWQYLAWQTVIDGKLDRLPAELFGRLPLPGDLSRQK